MLQHDPLGAASTPAQPPRNGAPVGLSPAHKAYPNYGGRGITVCPEWRESLQAFVNYMGPRPSLQHSLDRWPDNNGPYAPGNVRWGTWREQHQNKRSTRMLTHNGITKSMVEWTRDLGGRRGLIINRLNMGWSLEKALTEPLEIHRNVPKRRK